MNEKIFGLVRELDKAVACLKELSKYTEDEFLKDFESFKQYLREGGWL